MVKAIRPDVLEKIVGTSPVKRLGLPCEIASIIPWLPSEEGGYSTGRISGALAHCIWLMAYAHQKTNPAAAGFVVV